MRNTPDTAGGLTPRGTTTMKHDLANATPAVTVFKIEGGFEGWW